MKRLLLGGEHFLLTLAAAFCTAGAFVSAFPFGLSAWELLPLWAAAALLFTALAALWRGKGLLLVLPVALAALIYFLPEIVPGAKWILFFITDEFNQWSPLPVLFPGAKASPEEIRIFFAAFGIALLLPLSALVRLRHSCLYTVILTLPLVLPTFVLVEYIANPGFLVGLLTVYLCLLLGSALRSGSVSKRGLTLLPALALLLPLLGITYLLAPPATYSHSRGQFIESMNGEIRAITKIGDAMNLPSAGWPSGNSGVWRFDVNDVAIAGAGRRIQTGQSLLEVTSTEAGTFYLRGYAMRTFDGRDWRDAEDLNEVMPLEAESILIQRYDQLFPESAPATAAMTIKKTGDVSDLNYYPYYSYNHTNEEPDDVNFFILKDSLPDLAAALSPVTTDYSLSFTQTLSIRDLAYADNLQIDYATAGELRRLAAEAGIDVNTAGLIDMRAAVAAQVARYISSAAKYTLAPMAIPQDEDFTLYFLETSKEGYCVHFATAAAMMLRALGIPARFVSGYVVTISEAGVGKPATVTDKSAHSWVEVYYDNAGWAPLEVTPAAASSAAPVGSSPAVRPSAAPKASPAPSQKPQTNPGSVSPSPTPGTKHGGTGQPGPGAIFYLVLSFAAAGALLLLLFLRRRAARKRREKDFHLANTDEAALRAWRYITRLNRHGSPPGEIEALALKARFSQHCLSAEERDAVVSYATELAEATYRQRGLCGRLVMKYVKGLY